MDTDGSGDTTGTDSSEGNSTGKEEVDTNKEELNDAANSVNAFGGNATVILHEDGSLSIQSNITALIEYHTSMADALDDTIKKLSELHNITIIDDEGNESEFEIDDNAFEINANEFEIIYEDLMHQNCISRNRYKEQSKEEMKDYKPKDFYEAFNQLMKVHDICVHGYTKYLSELSTIQKIIIFNNKQKAKSDQDEYNSLKEERDNLKREKEKFEQEIIQLTKEIQNQQMKNKEIIESYNKEIAEMKSVIDQLTSKTLNQTKQENQHEAIIEEYKPIMKAMYQCPSMNAFFKNGGFGEKYDDSDSVIIKFIENIGSGYMIASVLIRYMGQYKYNQFKNKNDEPLTENEKSLIKLINDFYKKKYNLEDTENVLYIPKGMENSSNFKVSFKKQEMQDIEKATGNFQYAVALYCPGYHEPNSTIFKAKAIVRGK